MDDKKLEEKISMEANSRQFDEANSRQFDEANSKSPFYFKYFKPEILEKMFENESRILFLWPVKYDSTKFCDCLAESACMGKIAFENLYSESSECFPICCERAMQEVLQTSYDELVIQVDQEEIFPFSNIIFGQYWNKITIKTIADIDKLLQSHISCNTLQLNCTTFYRKYFENLYRLLLNDQIQKIKLLARNGQYTSEILYMIGIKLQDPYEYGSNIIFKKDGVDVYNTARGELETIEFDPIKFFGYDV